MVTGAPRLIVRSFAYSRGPAPEASLVVDMRFLRNPHWQEGLRALTGQDEAVGAYIAGDDAYAEAMDRIEGLILALLPRFGTGDRPCFSVAFGCTGGRHRSVHVAERIAARLRAAGFSLSLDHRDLVTPPGDGIERSSGDAA
jgi:RNase adapter protein RapZ